MGRARAIIAAALVTAGPAGAGDPVYGTWALDPARSHAESADDICYVTTLDDLGNGKFRETSTRITSDGAEARQDAVFAFDGIDHPNGLGATAAFTRIDTNRYAMVLKNHGKAIVMRTISADGATMTHIADGTINGRPFHDALIFERKTTHCEPDDKKP